MKTAARRHMEETGDKQEFKLNGKWDYAFMAKFKYIDVKESRQEGQLILF